ncbi:MAG: ribonuclease P protein component [Gemmatimonadota bacterium]
MRRISRSKEIERVRRTGRTTRAAALHARVTPSTNHASSGLGIIVPRHGRNAVERNLLKRRLRSILAAETFPAGLDVVLTAGPHAYGLTYEELRKNVRTLIRRLVSDTR